jgi:polyhydroxybutyrate depolymerase
MLHGFGSNMNNILAYSKMNDVADQNGFMICYPQGSTLATGQAHWNANLQMSTVNDIDFLSFLAIKNSEKNLNLVLDNVFTAGMSNGGFMSYTLGCEKSDVFKAVASITGTMSGYRLE